jgi:sirohydrochlorin cobaltochelatase
LKPLPDQANATLLLTAHGSSHSSGNNPTLTLAEHLKAQGLFADVRCGFLKEEPQLTDVLSDIQTQELYVVPLLTGHGYITDELIPNALSQLDSSITVHLCKPLGTHNTVPTIMANRARSVIKDHNLKKDQVSVLVAAHGNEKNPENACQTKNLAARIESLMDGIQTTAAFIDQAPLISDWPSMTSAENLIVLPFLIGDGLHTKEDVPAMLGLDGKDKYDETDPMVAHGRNIWCCRPLGFEPDLANIVLKLVDEKE